MHFIFLFFLIFFSHTSFAQQQISRDELPNTDSSDSTAVLNNNLRLQQNAINSIGGYFNSSLQLTEANGGTGANLSNYANGSILIQDTANVGIGTFGQGSAGQVVVSAGAGQKPIWGGAPFVPTNIQIFTTSGTWTKPSTVSNVYIKVIGGGGNGGTSGNTFGAGGGGGGGYAEGTTAVTGNVTVTIGNPNSFAGSTTISATSGSNGGNGSAGASGAGGVGGVGSNGTINLTGSVGSDGLGAGPRGTALATGGGAGGGSAMGPGAGSAMNLVGGNSNNGYAGANLGGGGSGSTGGNGGTGTGGAGQVGAVIVYY